MSASEPPRGGASVESFAFAALRSGVAAALRAEHDAAGRRAALTEAFAAIAAEAAAFGVPLADRVTAQADAIGALIAHAAPSTRGAAVLCRHAGQRIDAACAQSFSLFGTNGAA